MKTTTKKNMVNNDYVLDIASRLYGLIRRKCSVHGNWKNTLDEKPELGRK